MIDTIFRAWYYKEKRMIKDSVDLALLFLEFLNDYEHEPLSHIGFITSHEGRLADMMMYSTVKDKNGNLICDGDIVYEDDLYRVPMFVTFNGCAFIISSARGKNGDYLGWMSFEHLEIIGNKYEGIKSTIPKKIRSQGEMLLKKIMPEE